MIRAQRIICAIVLAAGGVILGCGPVADPDPPDPPSPLDICVDECLSGNPGAGRTVCESYCANREDA